LKEREKGGQEIYKTIILPVVLYVCETSSLTREEHRLRVFENRRFEETA
jgi:hypothetical protein